MWFASTANALWESGGAWRSALGKTGAFAAVLLAVFVFGSVRMTAWEPRSRTVPAAAVIIDRRVRDAASSQVNWVTFDRSTDAERAAARPRFQATVDDMLGRMETALLAGAKIVGCQETSAMVLEEDRQEVLQRASALARRYDAFLQVSLWVATRSASWPYVQNQSILIDNTGAIRASYEKTHPVAGGEAFIVFHGSSSLPLVETPQGKVCTAICNDMHFPALIREAGRGGADILIAPYDEIRPIESRAVASARAIENGVSLIRPTGNGVSLLTDYEGRVLGRLESARSTSGIVVTEIPTKGVRTVYAAVGDLFAYLCVAGLVALAVLALARRSRAAAPAHSA
jgi:apolipoprotein N-acyltransferase